MISETDTGWCASEDVGSQKGVDCEIPHWVREENETFLIRV